MSEKQSFKNIGLFIIIILSIGFFIWWEFVNQFAMISETIAMILFAVSIIFKAYNFRKGQYFIIAFLIILLLNVIKFSYTVENEGVSTTYYSASFSSLGFNPIVFVILIFYLIYNRKFIIDAYKLLMRGSSKEQEEKNDKEIVFYYNMFVNCSDEELNKAFILYNDYPENAQKALNKIRAERPRVERDI